MDLGLLLFGLLTCTLGALVWFGVYRSWARPLSRGAYVPAMRLRILAAPWLGLLSLLVMAAGGLRFIGIVLPSGLLLAATFCCLGIGATAGLFQYPSWALPPWFRAQQRSPHEAREEDNPRPISPSRRWVYRHPRERTR